MIMMLSNIKLFIESCLSNEFSGQLKEASGVSTQKQSSRLVAHENSTFRKEYFHLCQRMDFLQSLHINKSLYTNYENVFIDLDS